MQLTRPFFCHSLPFQSVDRLSRTSKAIRAAIISDLFREICIDVRDVERLDELQRLAMKRYLGKLRNLTINLWIGESITLRRIPIFHRHWRRFLSNALPAFAMTTVYSIPATPTRASLLHDLRVILDYMSQVFYDYRATQQKLRDGSTSVESTWPAMAHDFRDVDLTPAHILLLKEYQIENMADRPSSTTAVTGNRDTAVPSRSLACTTFHLALPAALLKEVSVLCIKSLRLESFTDHHLPQLRACLVAIAPTITEIKVEFDEERYSTQEPQIQLDASYIGCKSLRHLGVKCSAPYLYRAIDLLRMVIGPSLSAVHFEFTGLCGSDTLKKVCRPKLNSHSKGTGLETETTFTLQYVGSLTEWYGEIFSFSESGARQLELERYTIDLTMELYPSAVCDAVELDIVEEKGYLHDALGERTFICSCIRSIELSLAQRLFKSVKVRPDTLLLENLERLDLHIMRELVEDVLQLHRLLESLRSPKVREITILFNQTLPVTMAQAYLAHLGVFLPLCPLLENFKVFGGYSEDTSGYHFIREVCAAADVRFQAVHC